MSESIDLKVRRWLYTQPGLFQSETEAGVIEKALKASKIKADAADFTAALDRAGHRARQLTRLDGSAIHQLPLPEKPGGLQRLPAGRRFDGLRDSRNGQI